MMEPETPLQHWVGVLRRRIVLIAICTIGVPVVAVGVSFLQDEEYTTTASILLRSTSVPDQLVGAAGPADPTRSLATDVSVITSEAFAEQVSNKLKGTASPGDVAGAVQVIAPGTSDYIEIQAVFDDPVLAADIANTMAQTFISYRRNSLDDIVNSARETVQQRIDEVPKSLQKSNYANQLRNQLSRVEIVASVERGTPTQISTAEAPGSPSSPRRSRYAMIGLVLGLLLGVGLAVGLDLIQGGLATMRPS